MPSAAPQDAIVAALLRRTHQEDDRGGRDQEHEHDRTQHPGPDRQRQRHAGGRAGDRERKREQGGSPVDQARVRVARKRGERAEDRLPLVRPERQVRRQPRREERGHGHEPSAAAHRVHGAREHRGRAERRDGGGREFRRRLLRIGLRARDYSRGFPANRSPAAAMSRSRTRRLSSSNTTSSTRPARGPARGPSLVRAAKPR